MRDIFLMLLMAVEMPLILLHPHIGILLWIWLGYMHPTGVVYGFAQTLPLAQVVGLLTLLMWVLSPREKMMPPLGIIPVLLVVLVIHVCITTILAHVHVAYTWELWDRAMKVWLMTWVTMCLINNRQRLHAMVWVIVISLGYYGVKGGLFAIVNGMQEMVFGPAGGVVADNNGIGLALVMTVPLMRYLQLQTANRWIRWGLVAAMACSGLAIISTYSRGAFLAIACMVTFLALKSRQRLLVIGLIFAGLAVSPLLIPQKWYDRMQTLKTYQEDGSAQGRFLAWEYGYKLALDRPLIGGGYGVIQDAERYRRLVPEQTTAFVFHSIYFDMLGYHGFIGLGLFLALGFSGYFTASSVIRRCRGSPEQQWAADLARMAQVSLVGFAVGGAFLSLHLFEMFYDLLAIVVGLSAVTSVASQRSEAGQRVPTVWTPSAHRLSRRF